MIQASSEALAALDRCELTRELPPELRAQMVSQAVSALNLAPGEVLFQEGDPSRHWYLLLRGELEILKTDPTKQAQLTIALIAPGKTVGEMALTDQSPRSATVRARSASELLAIDLQSPGLDAQTRAALLAHWQGGLNKTLAERLRSTNDTTVASLRAQLNAAEQQLEMSKFVFRLLVGLCFYMFALGMTTALSKVLQSTTIISIPILIVFAIGVIRTVQTSPWPASVYGFTLVNWKRHTMEALLWSVPVLVVIVALKWMAIQFVPAMQDMALFDWSRSTGMAVWQVVLASVAYCLFTPVQETIARCAIQSSMMMLMTHRHRIRDAIFLSNLTFSVTHIHISMTLALAVFPLGIFWGWMFARQRSMVGSSVSHALIGTFAMSILGVPGFF